ncbi:MAG: hypothetical protein Q9219_006936 [cf. Caloplaca sp. 3 TL-2023]
MPFLHSDNTFTFPQQTTQPSNENLKLLFLYFLFPTVVAALSLNLWLAFVRRGEYSQDGARCAGEFEENWLLADNDDEGNGGIQEGPLSPEEVDRLIGIFRAEQEASRATTINKSSCRKRKATDEDSPVSDAATDGSSPSPRARKLKIDTNCGINHRWVSEVPVSHSNSQEESQNAGWGEFPFTFRASHPDRAIRAVGRH